MKTQKHTPNIRPINLLKTIPPYINYSILNNVEEYDAEDNARLIRLTVKQKSWNEYNNEVVIHDFFIRVENNTKTDLQLTQNQSASIYLTFKTVTKLKQFLKSYFEGCYL